jgi:hypothetical protein
MTHQTARMGGGGSWQASDEPCVSCAFGNGVRAEGRVALARLTGRDVSSRHSPELHCTASPVPSISRLG